MAKPTQVRSNAIAAARPMIATSSNEAPRSSDEKMTICSAMLENLMEMDKKETEGAFSVPVDQNEHPSYGTFIEKPMDFGTIKTQLNDGKYTLPDDFARDVRLTFSNAITFNVPRSPLSKYARAAMKSFDEEFERRCNSCNIISTSHCLSYDQSVDNSAAKCYKKTSTLANEAEKIFQSLKKKAKFFKKKKQGHNGAFVLLSDDEALDKIKYDIRRKERSIREKAKSQTNTVVGNLNTRIHQGSNWTLEADPNEAANLTNSVNPNAATVTVAAANTSSSATTQAHCKIDIDFPEFLDYVASKSRSPNKEEGSEAKRIKLDDQNAEADKKETMEFSFSIDEAHEEAAKKEDIRVRRLSKAFHKHISEHLGSQQGVNMTKKHFGKLKDIKERFDMAIQGLEDSKNNSLKEGTSRRMANDILREITEDLPLPKPPQEIFELPDDDDAPMVQKKVRAAVKNEEIDHVNDEESEGTLSLDLFAQAATKVQL